MGKNKKKIISGKRIFRETKDDDKKISESTKDKQKFDDKETAGLSEKQTETQSQNNIRQSATATTTNIQSSVDNQHFDDEVPAGVKDNFNKIVKNLTEQLENKDQECAAAVSKSLKDLEDAQERFKREISEREDYCEAVLSEKKALKPLF